MPNYCSIITYHAVLKWIKMKNHAITQNATTTGTN